MQVAKVSNDIAERLLYIAKLNPRGVNKLAYRYGYEPPRNSPEARFNFLVKYYNENCDEDQGIDDLLLQHPDFTLFAETFGNHLKKKMGNQEELEVPIDYYPRAYVTFEDQATESFVGAIADAAGATATAVGKFAGTGKKGREASQKLSEEETKRQTLNAYGMLLQQKESAKKFAEKNKTTLIIVAIIVAVLFIGGTLWFVLRDKK